MRSTQSTDSDDPTVGTHERNPDADGTLAAASQISSSEYLDERLAQYQSWYDRKAVKMKALHLRLRTMSVIDGAGTGT